MAIVSLLQKESVLHMRWYACDDEHCCVRASAYSHERTLFENI